MIIIVLAAKSTVDQFEAVPGRKRQIQCCTLFDIGRKGIHRKGATLGFIRLDRHGIGSNDYRNYYQACEKNGGTVST